MLVSEEQQNFGAFISGKSRTHLRLSLPCGADSLGYFSLFFRKFRKFQEVIQFLQNVAKMRHHYARAVGSGIDFLFMFASRMLVPMNLGFFWSTKNRNLICNLCCSCCHACSEFPVPSRSCRIEICVPSGLYLRVTISIPNLCV